MIPNPSLFLPWWSFVISIWAWWDDSIVLAQIQAAGTVVAVILAVKAYMYAREVAKRQFKMMKDQGEIVDKQLKIMEEQTAIERHLESMTLEQGVIVKRQGEIAETQHNFLKEQLARKTNLRVISPGNSTRDNSDGLGQIVIRLNAHNFGDKSADGFYWEILVPENIQHFFAYLDDNGEALPGKISHQESGDTFKKVRWSLRT